MIEERLKELGLLLPETTVPGGNYVSLNIRGVVGFVAIQFPVINEQYHFQGRLGAEISTEEGYKAMQLCALNVLAQINKHITMEKFVGMNHLDACYQCVDGWDDAPVVADGASDLFINVLAEKGRHARGICRVAGLPRNFSVGLTATFTIDK